jgi:hypothetical protein
MEKIDINVIMQIINKNIDLFKFMKLNNEITENMFSPKYFKYLEHSKKKNSLKYHPDKCINGSDEEKKDLEEKFNLNQIIYKILSSESTYNQYLETKKFLSVKSHNDLKSSFSQLNDTAIKEIIKNTTNNKSFKELSKEKDILHGYDKSKVNSIDINEFNSLLNNFKSERDINFEEIKKNMEEKMKYFDLSNKNFMENFNKEFEKTIEPNKKNNLNETYEIQAYNSVNSLTTSNLFDYNNFNYDNIYAPVDSTLTESFDLISNKIPSSNMLSNTSLEDRIKNYNNETSNISKIVKQLVKN